MSCPKDGGVLLQGHCWQTSLGDRLSFYNGPSQTSVLFTVVINVDSLLITTLLLCYFEFFFPDRRETSTRAHRHLLCVRHLTATWLSLPAEEFSDAMLFLFGQLIRRHRGGGDSHYPGHVIRSALTSADFKRVPRVEIDVHEI